MHQPPPAELIRPPAGEAVRQLPLPCPVTPLARLTSRFRLRAAPTLGASQLWGPGWMGGGTQAGWTGAAAEAAPAAGVQPG